MAFTVAIAADHGGFELKEAISRHLRGSFNLIDLGAVKFDPDDDYPDFALALAQTIVANRAQRGILICGSGVGASIVANKIPGVRAGLCHDTYSAHQGVEHDDMNILCLGARLVGIELAVALVTAFLDAHFSGEERHYRRRQKVLQIEHQYLK